MQKRLEKYTFVKTIREKKKKRKKNKLGHSTGRKESEGRSGDARG